MAARIRPHVQRRAVQALRLVLELLPLCVRHHHTPACLHRGGRPKALIALHRAADGTYEQCPHLHQNGTDATPAFCHARLDPEGGLSSVPTILTTWLGLHFGLVLVHGPSNRATHASGYQRNAAMTAVLEVQRKLRHLGLFSTGLFVLGWLITPFWKMNKQLWSPSYLFFTAGSWCAARLRACDCKSHHCCC
eukprot:SAG11_NODE_5259_length_1613_cov_1.505945_2_plen_191_part_01